MTQRIPRSEFILQVATAQNVTVGLGHPNSETRDGIYISLQHGRAAATYFVGLDKEAGEMVYEWVNGS